MYKSDEDKYYISKTEMQEKINSFIRRKEQLKNWY